MKKIGNKFHKEDKDRIKLYTKEQNKSQTSRMKWVQIIKLTKCLINPLLHGDKINFKTIEISLLLNH